MLTSTERSSALRQLSLIPCVAANVWAFRVGALQMLPTYGPSSIAAYATLDRTSGQIVRA